MVTAVPFSATDIEALAPPPLELMTGALSLTLVTVTAIAWVSVFVPSEARDDDVVDVVRRRHRSGLRSWARDAKHERAGRWR